MSNLYDLSIELANINNDIIDAEGEISDVLELRLNESGLSFKRKVGGIGRWLLNLDAKEDTLDAEIKRLQKRKEVAKNLQGRLKAYVKLCMETMDTKKVELDTMTFSIQKNPPSVEIEAKNLIPRSYLHEEMVVKVDKKAIGDALKKGTPVLGARLITGKTSLRVR